MNCEKWNEMKSRELTEKEAGFGPNLSKTSIVWRKYCKIKLTE